MRRKSEPGQSVGRPGSHVNPESFWQSDFLLCRVRRSVGLGLPSIARRSLVVRRRSPGEMLASPSGRSAIGDDAPLTFLLPRGLLFTVSERMPIMRKSLGLLCASAMAAMLLASPAHAAIKWSYGSAQSTLYNTNNPFQTSAIEFDAASNNVEGDTGIIVQRLRAVWDPKGTAAANSWTGPDSFDGGPLAAYTVSVTLTDSKSQQQATLTWNGRFKGKNLTATSFSAPKDAFTWDSPLLQTVTLGDVGDQRTFTVEITSATPPGAPGDPGGAIYADATVVDGPGGQGQAPEPATLAMAALGLPGLFMIRRRFRKS